MKKLKPRRFNRSKKSLKNKILSVFLVLIMAFGMIPKQVYSNNYENVEIKDENLMKALKDEIKEVNPDYNNEYISKDDMELLVDIDLSNKGIKNVEGLENGVNLKSINLKGNKISDISPLRSLNKLENLDVSNQKIEINGIKSINEEVTIENPLVGLNKNVIKNIHGENLEVVDNFIKVNGIDENKLVEINFDESYDSKIFSGKILLETIKEDIEKESTEKEDVQHDMENQNIERYMLDANGNLDLRSFTSRGVEEDPNSFIVPTVRDAVIKKNLNSVEFGNTITRSLSLQTGVITSPTKLDFNRSFQIKGNLRMSNQAEGMAIMFHQDPVTTIQRAAGGTLGLYNNSSLRGIGVEVDPIINSYDSGLTSSHIAITSKTTSLQKLRTANTTQFNTSTGINYTVNWDARTNKLSFTYGNQQIEQTFSETDLINRLGASKMAYTSISGSQDMIKTGNVKTIVGVNSVDIEPEPEPDYKLEFYVLESDGSKTLVTDLNKIKEEDKVLIRYDIKNNTNMNELQSKILLSNNRFISVTDDGLNERKINATNDNDIKWYEPYIIKDSFKTYVGSNSVDDKTIDVDKFFAGEKTDFKLPSGSQTRTIEYTIQMPKIVSNESKILKSFSFQNEGTTSYDITKDENINGSEPVKFADKNLNDGLILNIKNSINEARPAELDGNAYEKELHSLENINLNQKGIKNLDGIENCINAKSIDLSENEISDVDPLSKLEGLTKLNLSNNKIGDNLTPLSKLSKLNELDLSFNGISKIDSLATLSGLTNLNLNNNHIKDISSLKNMSSTIYTIMNQSIHIKNYINTDDFVFDNIIIGSNGKRVNNVWTTGNYNGQYNPLTGKITWTGLSNDTIHNLEYEWEDTNYQGKVYIEVDQVKSPDYMVMIPSNIEMGDIKDEGQVGAEEFISMVSEKNISGEIKIYTDSEFTITNTKNSEDKARVFVYKTFEDRLNGSANDKVEPLVSLNNENKEDNFILKSPISNFKHNNVEYKGTMKFIIEHVN